MNSSMLLVMMFAFFCCCLSFWIGGAASALIQPASLNVPVGQTTTINCWIGRGESQYTRWFKQIPGETPQLILEYKRFSSEANFYGSGFSSSRFTSKSVDEENNQLVIKGTEVGDTAMYYCEKWVSAENQAVFGGGTKLIVEDTSLPSPSIKVFGPTDEEISMDGLVTLVCLATKLSVPFAEVSWTACGVKVTSGVTTSLAAKHNDGTFSISSYLSLPAIKWTSTERKFSCEVKPEGSGSRAVAHLDDARC
ncbi:immunoglobulin lambda-1 light chain-like [Polypterus senegalus]|uniref:immunoglobulin lambda-1 light chain-like n=1 Tax=Polypterus senegalus TaxID=55291 RepID=UPI001962ED7F|nr:immunoglobulin lambda-1 light chain-like [Polypterus senegalus]